MAAGKTKAVSRSEKPSGDIDCAAVSVCTGLQLRRAARLTTQIFDTHLAPSGLTLGQLGILTQLYAVARPVTMTELSTMIGMDPTTLNRTLKPLEAQKLIGIAPDKQDRRARAIHLTATGQKRLTVAIPLWRAADAELRDRIGADVSAGLSGLLRLANEKLRKPA